MNIVFIGSTGFVGRNLAITSCLLRPTLHRTQLYDCHSPKISTYSIGTVYLLGTSSSERGRGTALAYVSDC